MASWLSLLPTGPALGADVEAVRLWRAPDHTRVVFDVSEVTAFSTVSLENPERFVVDLTDSRLRADLASLPLEGTPIRQLRSGVREGVDLRLVFDLSQKSGPRYLSCRPATQRVTVWWSICLTR